MPDKDEKVSAPRRATSLVTVDVTHVDQRIYMIRGQKVMIDRDLAKLYGVPTMRLNEAVRRNIKRFPEDFMFQMTAQELENWISQIAISNSERMGLRKRPLVFTEQGIAMLSGVLNSDQAIAVNIAIMRAFVRMRQVLTDNVQLAHRVDELEQKTTYHDGQLILLFDLIHKTSATEDTDHMRISGFIGDSEIPGN